MNVRPLNPFHIADRMKLFELYPAKNFAPDNTDLFPNPTLDVNHVTSFLPHSSRTKQRNASSKQQSKSRSFHQPSSSSSSSNPKTKAQTARVRTRIKGKPRDVLKNMSPSGFNPSAPGRISPFVATTRGRIPDLKHHPKYQQYPFKPPTPTHARRSTPPPAASEFGLKHGSVHSGPAPHIPTHDLTYPLHDQNDNISFAKHKHIFKSALAQQEVKIKEIYKHKVQKQKEHLHRKAAQMVAPRKDMLEVVIKNYQIKFEEIICYFEEIKQSNTYLEKLSREINTLEKQNKFWIRTKQAMQNEINLDITLKDIEDPFTQKELIREAIEQQDEENKSYRAELERLLQERYIGGPILSEKLKQETDKQHTTFASIEDLKLATDSNQDVLDDGIAGQQRELDSIEADADDLQSQLDIARAVLGDIEIELFQCSGKLIESQRKYNNLVNHLQKQLLEQHQVLCEGVPHYRKLFQEIQQAHINLKKSSEALKRVATCEVCRQPFGLSREPYILWPCGHSSCQNCLKRNTQNALMMDCGVCLHEAKLYPSKQAYNSKHPTKTSRVNPIFYPPPDFQYFMARRHPKLYMVTSALALLQEKYEEVLSEFETYTTHLAPGERPGEWRATDVFKIDPVKLRKSITGDVEEQEQEALADETASQVERLGPELTRDELTAFKQMETSMNGEMLLSVRKELTQAMRLRKVAGRKVLVLNRLMGQAPSLPPSRQGGKKKTAQQNLDDLRSANATRPSSRLSIASGTSGPIEGLVSGGFGGSLQASRASSRASRAPTAMSVRKIIE